MCLDLKEERLLLEKDLQSMEGFPNTPPVHKPPFLPATSASGAKMPSVSPISTKLKPSNKTGTTGLPNKNVSLKASIMFLRSYLPASPLLPLLVRGTVHHKRHVPMPELRQLYRFMYTIHNVHQWLTSWSAI